MFLEDLSVGLLLMELFEMMECFFVMVFMVMIVFSFLFRI